MGTVCETVRAKACATRPDVVAPVHAPCVPLVEHMKVLFKDYFVPPEELVARHKDYDFVLACRGCPRIVRALRFLLDFHAINVWAGLVKCLL